MLLLAKINERRWINSSGNFDWQRSNNGTKKLGHSKLSKIISHYEANEGTYEKLINHLIRSSWKNIQLTRRSYWCHGDYF